MDHANNLKQILKVTQIGKKGIVPFRHIKNDSIWYGQFVF